MAGREGEAMRQGAAECVKGDYNYDRVVKRHLIR